MGYTVRKTARKGSPSSQSFKKSGGEEEEGDSLGNSLVEIPSIERTKFFEICKRRWAGNNGRVARCFLAICAKIWLLKIAEKLIHRLALSFACCLRNFYGKNLARKTKRHLLKQRRRDARNPESIKKRHNLKKSGEDPWMTVSHFCNNQLQRKWTVADFEF